ncbi:MAG: 30S ribosomal protein S6 [Chitinispirillaceae bacterium]|nr:30S ribosomal protein S6 [Chitinispirillaceae bacterium]
MIRPYESMVVFDGTLPEDVLQREQRQIEEIIAQRAGFEKTDVWGKRALAYPIHKKRTGYYCLFIFSGTGDVISELEKHIKLNDHILRHLTVVRDLKNDVARHNVALRKERPVVENEQPSNDYGTSARNQANDKG